MNGQSKSVLLEGTNTVGMVLMLGAIFWVGSTMIELEKERVKDILDGYQGDKKRYLKIIKALAIFCAVLMVELILVLSNGKDGVMMGIDIIRNIIK